MIRTAFPSIVALVLLSAFSGAAARDIGAGIVFSDKEISIISAYYRDQHNVPQGKTKSKGRKSLPPGIAKNLQRGKSLPPGIAKQVLPTRLIAALPPVPKGHDRIIVAGKILLVEIATQVVRDVLEDVILGH
ncbi:MAG: anti-virulence regulator CigR family protein [Gammaproteobacteria bacterium]|nr:anti-virulence regulator CigR family protein [Gammaproteobacteria bacterium]